MLKALVIAGNGRIYKVFLQEHNLNPQEYRYISRDSDLQGYHRHANPNLRILLLDEWWDSIVAPAWLSPPSFEAFEEFEDRILFRDEVEVVVVENITDPAELPKFLSSDNENIRGTAKKKLRELLVEARY